MKTKTLGWLVGLGALVPSFISCAQPAIECTVGPAGYYGFTTVYTIKNGLPVPYGE